MTRYERKEWTRLYEMALGGGASIIEACRFANDHLGYHPTGASKAVAAK